MWSEPDPSIYRSEPRWCAHYLSSKVKFQECFHLNKIFKRGKIISEDKIHCIFTWVWWCIQGQIHLSVECILWDNEFRKNPIKSVLTFYGKYDISECRRDSMMVLVFGHVTLPRDMFGVNVRWHIIFLKLVSSWYFVVWCYRRISFVCYNTREYNLNTRSHKIQNIEIFFRNISQGPSNFIPVVNFLTVMQSKFAYDAIFTSKVELEKSKIAWNWDFAVAIRHISIIH